MSGSVTVSVNLYGAFRQIGDGIVMALILPTGSCIADVRRALQEEILARHPDFAQSKLLNVSVFADETNILHNSVVITRDVQLAIIPPISGG